MNKNVLFLFFMLAFYAVLLIVSMLQRSSFIAGIAVSGACILGLLREAWKREGRLK